jgi:hypothetical protein
VYLGDRSARTSATTGFIGLLVVEGQYGRRGGHPIERALKPDLVRGVSGRRTRIDSVGREAVPASVFDGSTKHTEIGAFDARIADGLPQYG